MSQAADANNTFPALLHELHQLEFDYADGDGIDFEPYPAFLPEQEVLRWFKAWTGNDAADGSRFRIFGQDGTGGYAAICMQHDDRPLLQQPIVFLGSEGEIGVIARDFDDYLWLLAGGLGPFEAVNYADDARATHPAFADFRAFAEQHAKSARRPASRILADAAVAFPNFADWIEAQRR